MKIFQVILILLLVNFPSFAQETEENEANPEIEKYLRMQDSLEKVMQNIEESLNDVAPDEPEFEVPNRNDELLQSIPKQTLTKSQLVEYLASLSNKFEAIQKNKVYIDNVLKYFPPEKTKDYQQAGVIFWFNGGIIESIYAFLKSVQNTDDCLALNNISAMLNIAGYPHKAIPILKFLYEKYPKNKIVLNNIGQAYYELGELDEAYRYLTACTNIDRYDIQANNSKGHIEQSRGDIQQAQQSYRNSLNGGYNTSAAKNLERLNPDVPLHKQIDFPSPDRYPPTDDNIPFQCPEPISSSSGFYAFAEQMRAESEEWNRIYYEYDKQINESMQEEARKIIGTIQSGGRINAGTGIMFEKAVLAIGNSYEFTIDQINRLANWQSEWYDDFILRKSEAGKRVQEQCKGLSSEACCRITNAWHETFNLEAAGHNMDYCQKMWTNVKGHYNVVAYWIPYITSRGGILNKDLYIARGMLLGTAEKMCRESTTGMQGGDCTEFYGTDTATINVEFQEPKCRSVNIPMGVGSIEIGCDKLKFSGGEGIVGELTLDFATSQVTIGLGVGFEANTGIFNISQKDMAYIELTTDVSSGNTNVTDWGSKASAELTTGKILEPIGVNVTGIEGTVQTGYESGITASGSAKGFDQTLFDREVNISKKEVNSFIDE